MNFQFNNHGYYNILDPNTPIYLGEGPINNAGNIPIALFERDSPEPHTLERFLPFPNNLTVIDVQSDDLTELPALPNGLLQLDCIFNEISILPDLPDSLQRLNISSNQIETLPEILPPNLLRLYAWGNQLQTIPELPPRLTDFVCSENPDIDRLPQVLPTTLRTLHCRKNPLITSLPDLPPNLVVLSCERCNLTKLPEIPHTLKMLFCYRNQLEVMPFLPDGLEFLECQNNKLTKLTNLPNSLKKLECEGNNFDYDSLIKIIKWYDNKIENHYNDDDDDNDIDDDDDIDLDEGIEQYLELRQIYINQLRKIDKQSVATYGSLINQDDEKIHQVYPVVAEYAKFREPNTKVPNGGKKKTRKTRRTRKNSRKNSRKNYRKKLKKNKTKRKRHNDMKTKN